MSDVKKAEDKVTGMPPTPENLTSTGAPVDERFAKPPAPATPEAKAEEEEEEHAKRRPPKSEKDDDNGDDGPRGSSKKRR